MDNPIVAEKFFEENFFHNDKLLKEYYTKGHYQKFRNRVKTFKDYEANLEKTIYALLTYSIQDILFRECGNLANTMKCCGFLVLCGGTAINQYIPGNLRTVTTDIDFKFVPSFVGVPVSSEKYFGYLQYAKLMMWNEIGKLSKKLTESKFIKKRIKALQVSPIGKCLQIDFDKILFTRRYIILHKKKQSNNNSVSEGNVLIDVELFAVDVRNIKFFSQKYDSLSGILDFPFMRRGELGGRVIKGAVKGLNYTSITGRKIFNPNILVANKKYLIEDIYIMKSLGLRPHKVKKDRERMEKLAKYAYKVDVSNKNSNLNIIKKTSNKTKTPTRMFKQTAKMNLDKISRINPEKYEKYTTKLTARQVARMSFPMFGPRGANVNGYTQVGNSRYRFDELKHKWVLNKNRSYIKNTATYRMYPPPAKNWRKLPNVKINMNSRPSVYGYSMTRNKWIPSKVLSKVAKIPLVGFKDKNSK